MRTALSRVALLAAMATAVAALAAPVVKPLRALLVFNPSESVARGWYRIDVVSAAQALQVDDIVLARLQDGVAALAAQRGYLPSGVPILKRVGAVAPKSVCVANREVRVDGVIVGAIRTRDGAGRPMQAASICRRLEDRELFLLSSTSVASFDSRYFGPIDASAVLGVAHPLWTWDTQ